MEKQTLKATIQGLHEHLAAQQDIDPELRELLQTLDGDIHQLIAQDAPEPDQTNGVIDLAEGLAARFAADHPRAEALLREIVASLAKMGI